MNNTPKYHGGLVFHRGQGAGIAQFCRIVAATLEDYGHPVERRDVADEYTASVVTSQYMVGLELEDLADADCPEGIAAGPCQRLTISMRTATEGYEDRDVSELMLVVMLYRMVDTCNAERIEWLDPETVLTVSQFLSAFTAVSPRRVRTRQRTADGRLVTRPVTRPVTRTLSYDPGTDGDDDDGNGTGTGTDAEEEALARAFRCDEDEPIDLAEEEEMAQNAVRRLATWGMTGMVAFIAAPAAIPIAALNVVRGEDFRLNTQILSLTGLLTVLHGTGALGNLVSYLPI